MLCLCPGANRFLHNTTTTTTTTASVVMTTVALTTVATFDGAVVVIDDVVLVTDGVVVVIDDAVVVKMSYSQEAAPHLCQRPAATKSSVIPNHSTYSFHGGGHQHPAGLILAESQSDFGSTSS